MNDSNITIQSVTGVDVQLEIADAGSRSFAFIIDWHLRLAAVMAWVIVGGMIVAVLSQGGADGAFSSTTVGFILGLPAGLIYLLYHPLLEILMQGRTPGKRMAGIRILTRSGDVPGIAALLIRNIFRLVDSLPGVYAVGLGAVIFTKHRVRIGDIAAGTILVRDREAPATSFAKLGAVLGKSTLAPQAVDLTQELLQRWWDLDERTRVSLARQLLAKVDPVNHRADAPQPRNSELRPLLRRLLEN